VPLQNPPDTNRSPYSQGAPVNIPPQPQFGGQPPSPTSPTAPPNNNAAFGQLLSSQLGQISAGANQQLSGITTGEGAALGQQQTTDQSLLQQLQNTLAGLGIQQTALGQEQQYGAQQYGFEQQQQGLSRTGIEQALANLKANYGSQQQQFGLQGQEIGQQYQQGMQDITQSGAASGVLNTNTTSQAQSRLGQQIGNERKQLGIQERQAAQGYKYGNQQEQQALKQLGLTGQEQGAAYGYQQQQLQDALKQLGLQGTEAQQGYTQGTQQAANSYEQQMAQFLQQRGGVQAGETQQAQQLLAQLMQAGYTGQ